MDQKRVKSEVVTLQEYKDNLRLIDTAFDAELRLKLDYSIEAVGNYIGRDLRCTDFFSGPYAEDLDLPLDTALYVSQVSVNGVPAQDGSWVWDDGKLVLNGTFEATDEVTVETRYRSDIKMAILLIASKLFDDPLDRAEAITNRSHNLLKSYRKYAGR